MNQISISASIEIKSIHRKLHNRCLVKAHNIEVTRVIKATTTMSNDNGEPSRSSISSGTSFVKIASLSL